MPFVVQIAVANAYGNWQKGDPITPNKLPKKIWDSLVKHEVITLVPTREELDEMADDDESDEPEMEINEPEDDPQPGMEPLQGETDHLPDEDDPSAEGTPDARQQPVWGKTHPTEPKKATAKKATRRPPQPK